MITIEKRIVFNEKGEPLEVIIPWAQFCELSEALGHDLSKDEETQLREAREDSAQRRRTEFVALDDL